MEKEDESRREKTGKSNWLRNEESKKVRLAASEGLNEPNENLKNSQALQLENKKQEIFLHLRKLSSNSNYVERGERKR